MMRWPFVSRAVSDARDAMLRELLAGSKADYTKACERYDALLTKHEAFVAQMVEVATPKPAPVIIPPKPRERDAADGAIDFASAFDPRRRRHLEQFARARRAEGKDAQDIAQEILHPPQDGAGEWEMPE